MCYHSLTLGGRFDRATTNLWLHTGLYSGVMLSGATDLLVHFRCLPRPLDKLVHVLVFVNQGMLFAVHLTGSALSVMMHSILVGLVFAYAAAAAADFFFSPTWQSRQGAGPSPAPALAPAAMLRPFFLFLAGLWICETGEVLFPPVGHNAVLNGPTDAFAIAADREGLAWFLRYQDDPHLTMMVVPLYLSFYALCVIAAMCAALAAAARVMAGPNWRKDVMAETKGEIGGSYHRLDHLATHESNRGRNEPSAVAWGA